jgi:hypothetical protein
LLGEVFHLCGHDSKPPAGITSSRRFYGRVERKNIDLACYSSIHEYMVFDPSFYATYDVVNVKVAHDR